MPEHEDELLELTYAELRRLAERHLARERPDHTLQPTALVNEAFLRLRSAEGITDEEHFLATASRAMRHILVDHARAKGRQKRGGDAERVELDAVVEMFDKSSVDLVALADALDGLEAMDPELARLVELRFFGGLSEDAAANVLGVSRRTASRGWVIAKNWLREKLS